MAEQLTQRHLAPCRRRRTPASAGRRDRRVRRHPCETSISRAEAGEGLPDREGVDDRVPLATGAVRPASVHPHHRSTTGRPSSTTATAAPSSSRSARFSRSASADGGEALVAAPPVRLVRAQEMPLGSSHASCSATRSLVEAASAPRSASSSSNSLVISGAAARWSRSKAVVASSGRSQWAMHREAGAADAPLARLRSPRRCPTPPARAGRCA